MSNMIFLCFSIKDRNPLINDLFLSNFGVDLWYDRRNLFLGDNRDDANLEQGASSPRINYAIVLYSDNFEKGSMCQKEYKIIEKRYQNGELHIFPIFIGEVPKTIPSDYYLLKELVYNNISCYEDYNKIALHIFSKITYDEIADMQFPSLEKILVEHPHNTSLEHQLLQEYDLISKESINMRISALYYIFLCLSSRQSVCYHHKKMMRYVYYRACSRKIDDERRELQLLENIIVFYFNADL